MSLYRCSEYKGYEIQRLRNILICNPTIFWVQKGIKLVCKNNKKTLIDNDSLLLVPGGQRISIENKPLNGEYLAFGYTFCRKLKSKCNENEESKTVPLSIKLDTELRLLLTLAKNKLSNESKELCQSLILTMLKEKQAYDYFINSPPDKISDQLIDCLKETPFENHNIEYIRNVLAMSRSTLNRKLKSEGTTFRDVLLDFRMMCALGHIQSGIDRSILHLECGYEDKSKFNKKFVQYYGVSINDYYRTLNNNKNKGNLCL